MKDPMVALVQELILVCRKHDRSLREVPTKVSEQIKELGEEAMTIFERILENERFALQHRGVPVVGPASRWEFIGLELYDLSIDRGSNAYAPNMRRRDRRFLARK
jgi:hypothetical protein